MARRQSSTTSLSKYARVSSPDLSNKSLDFCNAFWGAGDAGVDVLLARLRGASRTVDELKGFWKERATIEEEYARRLSKLAKQTLGRDEIGDLRNSLDVLRLETDKQATAHMTLAQQLRNELEGASAAFAAKQAQFKRVYQAAVEKEFKTKQTQETYCAKAKEKYEQDCLRINSYTAQATLVQGKDLEKVNMKLERARQTVTANERDFQNYARVLNDTTLKWEKTWRAFCDSCQDLEEERIDFMKDNVWAYANAISTVCVADDEACEKIRVSLEQLELERDMDNFVRDYGTGNEIPDPPRFISYAVNADASLNSIPSNPRYANFPRSTQRAPSMAAAIRPPPPEEEPSGAGNAGIGAGRPESFISSQSRPPSVAPGAAPATGPPALGPVLSPVANTVNSMATSTVRSVSPGQIMSVSASPAVQAPISSQNVIQQGPIQQGSAPSTSSAAFRPPRQEQPSEAIGGPPGQKTMLQVGGAAYEVDPDKDPQKIGPGRAVSPAISAVSPPPGPASSGRPSIELDPLQQRMDDLRKSAASTTRRNSANVAKSPGPKTGSISLNPGETLQGPGAPNGGPPQQGLSAPAPGGSEATTRHLRDSAELVVGSHPASRSNSPANVPTANFMHPDSAKPPTSLPVEDVVNNYSQALPGERRTSVSRSTSPAVQASLPVQNSNRMSYMERPKSREGGQAGVGANGRSPSPRMYAGSPAPANGQNRTSYAGPNTGSVQNQANAQPQRAVSPAAAMGIALDASGNVAQDVLAERYSQQQQQNQRQPFNNYAPHRSQSVQLNQPGIPTGHVPYGGAQPNYHQQPPIQNINQAPYVPTTQTPGPHRQASVQSVFFNPHSPQQYAPASAPPQTTYQPPPQQPQQQTAYTPQQPVGYSPVNGANVARGPSANGYYGGQMGGPNMAPPTQNVPQSMVNGHGQQQVYNQGNMYRAPSPAAPRAVSPAVPGGMVPPTGQYTEDGQPVLFYVKALYDYQATIDEEFDFQAGDVIAVTSTPEDGWWTGVLLDDIRRVPGRTVFPSNFVCLF